jgi:hypothetical protein
MGKIMIFELINEIQKEFPDFNVEYKQSSTFMKVLDILLKIITFGQMKQFMTEYVTVIGRTVYVPKDWDVWADSIRYSILRHERVHFRQQKRDGLWWFTVKYLLLPFPTVFAWYRAKYEREAYIETLRVYFEFGGPDAIEGTRNFWIKQFTGPQYFWTWPWKKQVEKWFDEAKIQVISENFKEF